jgi:hypothetical protein
MAMTMKIDTKKPALPCFFLYDVLLVSQMVGFTQSQTAKSSHG